MAAYKSVDEVKDFRDKAVAIKAYARQAKDRELEIDAAEARLRAERRIGELIEEMPKAKGAATPKATRVAGQPASTLAEQGVDKNLADAARKAASIPEKEFEEILEGHRAKGKPIS